MILPPSVWMIVFALMSPQLHSAVENIHNDSDYSFLLNRIQHQAENVQHISDSV